MHPPNDEQEIYNYNRPKVQGNEDGKGLLIMHTFPPNRRLAQLRLWGCYKRRLMQD